MPAYTISFLKAWYGKSATRDNEWGWRYLPRINRDHSHLSYFTEMADGKVEGLFLMGQNPAVGGPENSPDFLNSVVEIETTLGSHDLLHRLLEIERHMGRERREKWSPRIIDLDLLLYGDKIISSDELVVPHPLMHTRRFVIEPLAEIAPDLVHPTLRVSIKDMLENL